MSLSDDLVREILSKLAVSIKSAARLSCICKSWREWIRHPDFFKPHPVMVIYKPGGDPQMTFRRWASDYEILTHHPDIVYPFNLPQGFRLRVNGECNGILCIQNLDHPGRPFDHLYNPITGEYRKLPSPGLLCSFTFYYHHGIGFDKRENDYKIIRFWKMGSTKKAMVEIYKLSTNCWANLDVDLGFIDDTYYFFDGSVFVNGSFYWQPIMYSPDNSISIVSFYLQTETFGHIKVITLVAPSYDGEHVDQYLGVLDDSLVICVIRGYIGFTEVWVMSEYRNMESNWTKKFTIKSSFSTTSDCCSWIHDARLFQLNSRSGEVLTCLTGKQGGEAQKARPRMFKADDRHCRSVVFKPSLVSLHNG